MIQRIVSPLNKHFSILGSKRYARPMMAQRRLRFDCNGKPSVNANVPSGKENERRGEMVIITECGQIGRSKAYEWYMAA